MSREGLGAWTQGELRSQGSWLGGMDDHWPTPLPDQGSPSIKEVVCKGMTLSTLFIKSVIVGDISSDLLAAENKPNVSVGPLFGPGDPAGSKT